MTMTAARIAAFAIALLAVADPSITASRNSRPVVAIVGATPNRSEALKERVDRVLARRFTVVRGAMPAAATVFVGDVMPDERQNLSSTVLGVTSAQAPSVRIASLEVPAMSMMNARTPIEALVIVAGARGSLTAELYAGKTLVKRQVSPIFADSASLYLLFNAVPATPGITMYRVVARLDGTPLADSATTVLDTRELRTPLLFFDLRASWLSTFVRRAVEEDPRFAITHRVLTSRGRSSTAGDAPSSLRDPQLLSRYSTIIVGAPDQLSDADVAGLETFMRRRGGRVILLMDQRSGGPVDRLTGVSQWRAVHLAAVETLDTQGDLLRAQEVAWPVSMPAGATVQASSVARDSTRRGVIWSIPIGAGRLMVSGALDAWHYRASGFDDFWANSIADQSAGAPEPIVISLSRRSTVPGQETIVSAWIRDAALSTSATRPTRVSAALVADGDTTIVRLWPEGSPGTYSARLVAPRTGGTYRVIVTSGNDRAEAALVVDSTALPATADERELIDAYVSSRRGFVVPEEDLESLPSRVASAIQLVPRVETWYPMRSAWWIVPFALLLGAEWWWRRRRGLA